MGVNSFFFFKERVVPRRGDLQFKIFNNESWYTVFKQSFVAFDLVLRVWYLKPIKSSATGRYEVKVVADHITANGTKAVKSSSTRTEQGSTF